MDEADVRQVVEQASGSVDDGPAETFLPWRRPTCFTERRCVRSRRTGDRVPLGGDLGSSPGPPSSSLRGERHYIQLASGFTQLKESACAGHERRRARWVAQSA
jgi:hypothetical protein